MELMRRDALTLAAGVAVAGTMSERALSCSQPPLGPFNASRTEKGRMTAKLEALRSHWNAGTIERFLSDHCSQYVEVNMFLDGKGGNWSDPLAALQMFHDRYKRVTSPFFGAMFDLRLPFLFSMAEFEPPPAVAPGPNDEIALCGPNGPISTFAVFMRFEIEGRSRKAVLVDGDRIVAGLSFRENWQLGRWFQSSHA